MISGALVCVLVASAAEPERLVVIDVASTDAGARKLGAQLSELVLTEASRFSRFRVLGQSDIVVMLGLERQKQLLGCADESSSCMAEIGGALNASWILTGALGRVGKKYRLDLKVIDTKKNQVTLRTGKTLSSSEALLDALPELVKELLSAIPAPQKVTPPPEVTPAPRRDELPPVVVAPAPAASRPLPWGPIAVGAVGLASAGAGLGLLLSAKADEAGWDAYLPQHSLEEAQAYQRAAQTKGTLGPVLLGVGGAAVAGAALWYAFMPRSDVVVSAGLVPGGAAVVVGGAW